MAKQHLNMLLKIITTTLLGLGVWLVIMWTIFLKTPLVTESSGYIYKLRAGASLKSVIADLHQAKIIKQPWFFTALVFLRGDIHGLKKGEYLFPQGTTPSKMLNQMVTGTGLVQHTFTILSGWNFRQLRLALEKEEGFVHLTKHLDDKTIMKRLGLSAMHPEGQFFPDTYYFIADSSDLALLKRAALAMRTKLSQAWLHRDENLPFKTPYEALIAASIIEKEARLDSERPIIAGVLVNRLRKNMLLQFDPTVIYGLGLRYNGKIYKRDLLEETPYNTYVHKGLTPTPISMPSLQSIQAVLHPKTHDYLYFVSTGDHASHTFSSELKEHDKAVTLFKQSLSHSPSHFFNSDLILTYLRERIGISSWSMQSSLVSLSPSKELRVSASLAPLLSYETTWRTKSIQLFLPVNRVVQ